MGWTLPVAFVSGLILEGASIIIEDGFNHYAEEAETLFVARFPNEAALAGISLEDSHLLSASDQADRLKAINALQAFSHAYTSAQIADDFDAYLTTQEANDFSRFIGDALEAMTHNKPTNFNRADENRDLWNNDYGLDNLTGLTKEQKADLLGAQVANYLNNDPTDLIFDWENDTRTFTHDPTGVAPDALDELTQLQPFFNNIQPEAGEDFPPIPGHKPSEALLAGWIPDVLTPFSTAEISSPLVFDIDMSGTIELAALNGVGSVYWESGDGDDFREASGWITGGDGLLCVLGGNGIVDGQSELFGNDATYANGYLKLDALYDSNNDNAITSADTNFGDLRMWVDSNADGYSQSTELYTLSSLGITSIATGYSTVSYTIAGNTISQESTFTMNGSSYKTVDAWFSYDNVNSEYSAAYTLDVRTLFLPDLRGYGIIPDLHIAMSEDETLLDLVQGIAVEDAQTLLSANFGLEGKVRDVLHLWAGAGGVSPTSRGSYVDARDLIFLERFGDNTFANGINPAAQAAVYINESWQKALNALSARILFQTSLVEIFDSKPAYNPATDTFDGTATIDLNVIDDLIVNANLNGENLLYGWRAITNLIDQVIGIGNLSSQEATNLDALIQSTSGVLGLTLVLLQSELDNPQALSAAANIFYGAPTNESTNTLGGNDLLIGQEGFDWLTGGSGDDTYLFAAGDGPTGDAVIEQSGEGTDTILLSGVNTADVRTWTDSNGNLFIKYSTTDSITSTGVYNSGSGVLNYVERIGFDNGTVWNLANGLILTDTDDGHSIYGSAQADIIDGRGGGDSIQGHGGNDTLIGGTGREYSYGGTGNDLYIFAAGDSAISGGGDMVYEFSSEGADRIILTDTAPEDVRMRVDSAGHLYINYTSTDEIYVLGSVNSYGETLVGSQLESIEFGDGTVWTLSSGLILTDTDAAHAIYGSAAADTIDGRGGGDSIYAYGGNDTVRGGDGTEWMYGGNGNDVLYGQEGTDIIFGESGNDTLDGGASDDYMVGGSDVDTVSYLTATAGVTVNLATTTAQNTIGWGTDTLSEFENLIGSSFNDTLTGDGSANVIEGGAGNDTMNGAGGIDTVSYTFATAAVTVNLTTTTAQNTIGAGSDTLSAFENLTGSSFNDTLTGDANANTILGGDGNDTIQGGAGNDILNGGNGTDRASYAAATAAVTVNLTTLTAQNTVGAGTDTLSGFENLLGSAFNDTLTGDGNANVIEGGAGNDIINGAGGTDTVSYAAATAAVTVNLTTTTAQNTVGAGSDTITNTENLTGSAFNDTLTGNSGANIIEGGAGNDIMNGSTGTDTLTYVSATAGVTVNLTTTTIQNTIGAGSDTITAFENLTGSAFNDTLTGNTSANVIEGGAGNDVINASGGTDTVTYATAATGITVSLALTTAQNTVGAGTDTITNTENLTGSAYNDTLTGNTAVNTLTGGDGNDALYGGSGNDILWGGNGVDTLSGQAGLDTLNGDAGADTFVFEAASAYSNVDVINGFTLSQSDKLDLSDLLDLYNPLTQAITDYVQITTSGSNSSLFVDRDGLAATYGFVQIGTLNGVIGLTDEAALVNSGNLVAV